MMRSRLILAATLPLALLGCDDDKSAQPAAPVSRFEAIQATKKASDIEAFCDVHFTEQQAAARTATGAHASLPPSDHWRWVNVWATWCHPCVEEIPRIAGWAKKLVSSGTKVELKFLSVDADQNAIPPFVATHPEVNGTEKLGSPAELPTLVQELGLDPGAAIPIHAFYDPSGKLRCVRTGSVTDDHYSLVERVLHGE